MANKICLPSRRGILTGLHYNASCNVILCLYSKSFFIRVYFSVTLKSGDEGSAGAFSKLMYKFDGSLPGCW